jgi:lysophospholipase L1-like esterase
MRKRSALAAALALAAAALSLVVLRPPGAAAAAPVRVMPLGDSITGSPGCWRALLWNRLQSSGHTEVDFVGTLPPQGCGVAHDGDNEGHGGILATTMAAQNQLPGWLSASRPDVVLMHLGTNDVWSNRPTQQILDAFSTLVTQMRASNPAIRILVAKIIPMAPSNCAECGARVVALNNALPGWASARGTAQSPIVVVDQWTGFSTSADTYDGVHPNAAGDQKMADRWYPALTGVLGGVLPTNPATSNPPTSNPPTSAPPTSNPPTGNPPTPAGGCAATVSVNQWTGGFVATVRVTAGSAQISGWRVGLTLASGATVANAWNAQRSGDTGAVQFSNAAYNGRLGAGQSTEFGFQASGSGAGLAPTCAPTA